MEKTKNATLAAIINFIAPGIGYIYAQKRCYKHNRNQPLSSYRGNAFYDEWSRCRNHRTRRRRFGCHPEIRTIYQCHKTR